MRSSLALRYHNPHISLTPPALQSKMAWMFFRKATYVHLTAISRESP
jgi:hypothetical protein